MYNENEFMTPRDRINEELLQRASENARDVPRSDARINCRGDEVYDQAPKRATWGLENYPLASVYSAIQHWRNLYEPEEALQRGTLFKELDLPFVCGEIKNGGNCCGK